MYTIQKEEKKTKSKTVRNKLTTNIKYFPLIISKSAIHEPFEE